MQTQGSGRKEKEPLTAADAVQVRMEAPAFTCLRPRCPMHDSVAVCMQALSALVQFYSVSLGASHPCIHAKKKMFVVPVHLRAQVFWIFDLSVPACFVAQAELMAVLQERNARKAAAEGRVRGCGLWLSSCDQPTIGERQEG